MNNTKNSSWMVIRAGMECLHASGVRCTIVTNEAGMESLKTDVPKHLAPGQWLIDLIAEATQILGGE